MNEFILTLINFSKSKLPVLAVRVESGINSSDLLNAGFLQEGDYFTITKEQANKFLETLLMQDYIKHWIWERTRYNGQLNQINLEKSTTIINLFNPYHDKIGQFAEVKGTPSAAMIASSKEFAEKKASSNPGSIVKTTGKVLGLAGISGLVGLMVLKSLSSASGSTSIEAMSAKDGLTKNDAKLVINEELINKKQQELDELIKNWPKFTEPKQAVPYLMSKLRESGYEMPIDIKTEIAGLKPGLGGEYNLNTNTLTVDPILMAGIVDGDPASIHILVHEMLHSNQEIDTESGYTFTDENGEIQDPNGDYKFFIEGSNDLATMMITSNMYGNKMNNRTTVDLSNQYSHLNSEIKALKNGVMLSNTNVGDISDIGYETYAGGYASLLNEYSKIKNIQASDLLKEQHKNAYNIPGYYNMLMELFPTEMKESGHYKTEMVGGIFGIGAKETITGRTLPTYREIEKWMDNHGYVDRQKALDMMLETAVK